jgi:uncharacterized protein DUF5681
VSDKPSGFRRSNKTQDEVSDGEAVGYGRPPKSKQFRPGTSGNLRGRPKGSRSLGAIIQKILNQKVTVTDHGKTQRVSRLEVMVRQLANDAMRGDIRSAKLFLDIEQRHVDQGEGAHRQEDLAAEDRAILKEFLREAEELQRHSELNPKTEADDDEKNQ